jgi:hypothetical protein
LSTPGTSFQITTLSASRHQATIAAEKSDPSLPNVVDIFSAVAPINP